MEEMIEEERRLSDERRDSPSTEELNGIPVEDQYVLDAIFFSVASLLPLFILNTSMNFSALYPHRQDYVSKVPHRLLAGASFREAQNLSTTRPHVRRFEIIAGAAAGDAITQASGGCVLGVSSEMKAKIGGLSTAQKKAVAFSDRPFLRWPPW